MEVLTVVGGAASVIQLIQSIKQLVDFWSTVQDAPENINSLFNDLELLSEILVQISQLNQHHGHNLHLEKATVACERQISGLQKKIAAAVSGFNANSRIRQKWSSLKISLKDKEILGLRSTVADTKSTLMLVLQSYLP